MATVTVCDGCKEEFAKAQEIYEASLTVRYSPGGPRVPRQHHEFCSNCLERLTFGFGPDHVMLLRPAGGGNPRDVYEEVA